MVSPVGMMVAPLSASQLAAQQQAVFAQQQAQLAAARQQAAQAAAQRQATAAANAIIAQQAAAARVGIPTASQEVIAAQAQAAAQAAAAQELAARQAAQQLTTQQQTQSTLPPLSSTAELQAQVLAVQQSAQAAQQQIALQQEITNQQAAAVRQANEAALAASRAIATGPSVVAPPVAQAPPVPTTTPGIEQVRQQAAASAQTANANIANAQSLFAQTQAQSAAQDQLIQQQAAAQAAQIAEAQQRAEAARAAAAEQQRLADLAAAQREAARVAAAVAPPSPVTPPAPIVPPVPVTSPPAPSVAAPQTAAVAAPVSTLGIVTLPDGSKLDLGNLSLSPSVSPTGLFTGQQAVIQPTAPIVPTAPIIPTAPIVPVVTPPEVPPTLGTITLPDGNSIDLGNVSLSPSGAPTGLFTGTQGVATMAAPTASVEPPVAPQVPPMLGNTDYTIRETPASALSMLGGLPVSLPSEVTSYLSSQPQIVSPFQGMPSLAGAQDIFGGRSYVTHSTAGPEKRRVGLMEMKQLNQADGYNTTVRPEFLGETYLPFRPEGSDPNVVNDTKLWHQYYTDNKDYRKYLSADEQTELAWLDYRTGLTDKNQFTSAVNQVRENFNLPQKVAFEDFEAHFSIGTKRKKYSDNPYQDLQDYGPSIGGYWNPENDPSETQQVLSNPFVQTAVAVLGSMVNPYVGALASTAVSRASGADWKDALISGAVTGITAGIGEYAKATQAAQAASQAASGGATSGGLSLLGLNPQVTNALVKGAGALAQGGDIKDVLVSAGLGYAGGTGGMLSKTLGDLGLNVGEGVISKAVEGLNLADVAKFGFKSTQDFGSALGGLIQNMDLGTLEQTGLTSVLPQSIQDAIRKVQLSDVLAAGAGGLDQGLAFNILNDINLPAGMLNIPNINLPNINLPNVGVPQLLKDAYEAAESVVQKGQRAVESVVQPVAQQVEKVASKGYEFVEQAIQDAVSVITPSSPGSMFNLPPVNLPNIDVALPNINLPNVNMPNVDIPNVNAPNINTPDVNIPNVNVPNININMPAITQGQAQRSMFEKFNPYLFAGIKFDPRMPVVPTLQPRGQDPLSILLRG